MVQGSADVQIVADAGELFVLLKNLIENAIDCSPRGGTVRITLSSEGLRVEDQGPGVPEAYRTLVFERFWRAPDNRNPGSGLGLAICMDIASAHGWRLECRASALGGALFEVGFVAVGPRGDVALT